MSTFWVCPRLFAESCREVVRIRMLLSLFLLAAVATSGQEDLPPSLETRLAVGVEALKSGDLVTADRVFSEAVQQGVRHPLVFHNLGVIAQERGDHKRAVVRFRQSLQLKTDYGPSRLLLGVSLMALGKNAEAVRELERAVRLMPNETQAHLQLAKAYETSDNWIAAVPELQRVVELAPQQPEYSYQLGRAWAKLSGWSYQQIRRLNPDSARLQQALGQEYAIQEKYDAALAAYQRAARSDPNLPEIHLAAAVILLELKRFDEALVEIDLEGKLVPDSKAAAEIRAKIEAAKASSSP